MYVKISKVRVTMLIATLSVLLLLFSEVQFYVGLNSTSIVTGMQKTILFAGILLCAAFMLTQKHPRIEKVILVFVAFTIATIISTTIGITPDIAVWRQNIHLTYFCSILIIFYIGTEKLGINEVSKYVKILFVVLLGVYLYALVKSGIRAQNSIYYVIIFLPMLVFLKRPTIKKSLAVVLVILALLSNKRTVFLSVLAYFLTYEFMSRKDISKNKKIIKAIGYSALIIFIYFIWPIITQDLNITVLKELSLANIQADGGSNRIYIYSVLWKNQLTGSVKHWLIGDGYNAVLLAHICKDGVGGGWVSAHNDFLEIIYDYGIVGFVLYISFLVMLIRTGIKMQKMHYEYASAFMGTVIMVIVMSMTSHLIIYLNYYVIIFMFWAICISDYNVRKREM